MLFSSFTFLFIFFPLVLFTYFIINNRVYRNIVLLVFSLIFYAWGEPKYVILMILMIVINYVLGLIIEKLKVGTYKKVMLILSIIINFSVLGYFKYTGFFVSNFNTLFDMEITIPNIILPIGISFYTFQILSYIFDVYSNKVKAQKNILYFATYVSLFPQLIAGPIVRYIDVENELVNRKESISKVQTGLRRFIIGLGKKIIISNNVAIIANDVFTMPLEELTFGAVWIGLIAFTLQIYYDFSGYSDMAIGLGKIFGFNFLENFDYPYISKNITEFWRRWHMSLSSWFRDYVYFPMGGSRVGKVRLVFNLFIVWSFTGLWHGASWNFVLWGLYFFLILLLEKFTPLGKVNKIPVINHVYSILLIMIGWLIFNATSNEQIITMIKLMFSFDMSTINVFAEYNYYYLIPQLIIGIIFSLPIIKVLKNYFKNNWRSEMIADIFSIMVFIVSIMYLVNDTYNPFIYFRF